MASQHNASLHSSQGGESPATRIAASVAPPFSTPHVVAEIAKRHPRFHRAGRGLRHAELCRARRPGGASRRLSRRPWAAPGRAGRRLPRALVRPDRRRLGAWKAGCAYLPLDPAWPDGRLRRSSPGRRIATSSSAGDDRCADRGHGSRELRSSRSTRTRRARRRERRCGPDAGHVPTSWPMSSTPRARPARPRASRSPHANLANLIAWHDDAFARDRRGSRAAISPASASTPRSGKSGPISAPARRSLLATDDGAHLGRAAARVADRAEDHRRLRADRARRSS